MKERRLVVEKIILNANIQDMTDNEIGLIKSDYSYVGDKCEIAIVNNTRVLVVITNNTRDTKYDSRTSVIYKNSENHWVFYVLLHKLK